jgi:hypothetical protein
MSFGFEIPNSKSEISDQKDIRAFAQGSGPGVAEISFALGIPSLRAFAVGLILPVT